MVGQLFQNYDTIYVQFFPCILAIIPATRYTCVFFATYTCVLSFLCGVFIPKYMAIFSQARIYSVFSLTWPASMQNLLEQKKAFT